MICIVYKWWFVFYLGIHSNVSRVLMSHNTNLLKKKIKYIAYVNKIPNNQLLFFWERGGVVTYTKADEGVEARKWDQKNAESQPPCLSSLYYGRWRRRHVSTMIAMTWMCVSSSHFILKRGGVTSRESGIWKKGERKKKKKGGAPLCNIRLPHLWRTHTKMNKSMEGSYRCRQPNTKYQIVTSFLALCVKGIKTQSIKLTRARNKHRQILK